MTGLAAVPVTTMPVTSRPRVTDALTVPSSSRFGIVLMTLMCSVAVTS